MSFGLTTWKADGTPVITPQGAGGVYVETLVREQGAGAITVTYPSLAGMSLRVFQVSAGSYTWSIGIGAGSIPYITLAPLPATFNGGPLYLMVFAT